MRESRAVRRHHALARFQSATGLLAGPAPDVAMPSHQDGRWPVATLRHAFSSTQEPCFTRPCRRAAVSPAEFRLPATGRIIIVAAMRRWRSIALDALPLTPRARGRSDLSRGRVAVRRRTRRIRKTHGDGVVFGHVVVSHLRAEVRHKARHAGGEAKYRHRGQSEL